MVIQGHESEDCTPGRVGSRALVIVDTTADLGSLRAELRLSPAFGE